MTSVFASTKFWLETSDRAIRTFAQSAVALLTAEYASIVDIDLPNLLGVSGLAAIVSVLTRIATAGETTQASITEAKQEVEVRKVEKELEAFSSHAIGWEDNTLEDADLSLESAENETKKELGD